MELLDLLKAAGYMASPTHFTPTGIKTSAPLDVVEKLVEDLVKQREPHHEN